MSELVPYQTKRKKTFKPSTTVFEATGEEITKYFKKNYPTITFGTGTILADEHATVLGKQILDKEPIVAYEVFIQYTAAVTSPTLLADDTNPWTLSRLEIPMLLLRSIADTVKLKKPYLLLPKPYQKQLKRLYTSQLTVERLSQAINSKKRAKKYLRILQRRLGLYTRKKRPFNQAKS